MADPGAADGMDGHEIRPGYQAMAGNHKARVVHSTGEAMVIASETVRVTVTILGSWN